MIIIINNIIIIIEMAEKEVPTYTSPSAIIFGSYTWTKVLLWEFLDLGRKL